MTPTRSLVHLANAIATRMEIDHAPKQMVEALRLFATDRTIRHVEKRAFNPADEKRCERQRTLFAMLPSSNATDRLKEAMLQRAYDLLWDGDPYGCDALTEFLPSKDVDKMLNAWSEDFDGAETKSHWHAGRS